MMPARRSRLKCSHVFTLIAVVFLVASSVHGQSGGGSVTLRATVSEIVALSVAPDFNVDNVDTAVVNNGSAVQLTLSGRNDAPAVFRVPLLVRSNSSFKISAVLESKTAELAQLSVTDVRPTGSLVSANVVKALDAIRPQINPDASLPLLLLSGPRVSLGGTLNSPNNALHVTLLIRLKSPLVPGSPVHLTVIATAER
jgi:hypothetical protein